MDTKICGKCKQEKPITEFYSMRENSHQSYCKPCKMAQARKYSRESGYFKRYWKEYENRPEVKERRTEQKRLYRGNPLVKIKNFARWYTNHEIRAGRVNREPCALCEKPQGEAHHPDYEQPLLIVWLCPDCHRRTHLKKL